MRSVAINVASKRYNVNFAQEYVDSGQILKSFQPKTVTPTSFGLGVYRKTGGTATGATGIVKLRPDANKNL